LQTSGIDLLPENKIVILFEIFFYTNSLKFVLYWKIYVFRYLENNGRLIYRVIQYEEIKLNIFIFVESDNKFCIKPTGEGEIS